MAKPELGTKRECPKCAGKFYDLQKNPAECPLCHHSFDPTAPVKKRGKKKAARTPAEIAPKIIPVTASKKRIEVEDEDDIDLPEFEDIGIMEDMDDLDDMDGVDVVGKKGGSASEEDDADDETFIDDDDLITAEEDDILDDEEEEDEDAR